MGLGAWACRGGEIHNFLLLVLLDRFGRRADFGFIWSRAYVEAAESLAQEFWLCHDIYIYNRDFAKEFR